MSQFSKAQIFEFRTFLRQKREHIIILNEDPQNIFYAINVTILPYISMISSMI